MRVVNYNLDYEPPEELLNCITAVHDRAYVDKVLKSSLLTDEGEDIRDEFAGKLDVFVTTETSRFLTSSYSFSC
jgi:hypothetical protein